MNRPSLPSKPGRTLLWRRLFWVYFVILTVALLWPKLQIPPVIPRPDLVVHGLAFGAFSLLLCLWNPLGSPNAGRTALLALAAGTAYGGVTEVLQAIPILNRTAAMDDFFADAFGVLCGLTAFGVVRLARRG